VQPPVAHAAITIGVAAPAVAIIATAPVLAKLSEASGFNKATEALLAALEHGVSDADSIKAVFSRLNSEVLNLAPLVLPASVPEMPTVKTNVENYDRLFLERVGSYGN